MSPILHVPSLSSQHFKALAEGKKAFTPPSNSTSQAGDAETLTFSWDTSHVTLFQGWAGFSAPSEKEGSLSATWRPCLPHSLIRRQRTSYCPLCQKALPMVIKWLMPVSEFLPMEINYASTPLWGCELEALEFLGFQDAQVGRKA